MYYLSTAEQRKTWDDVKKLGFQLFMKADTNGDGVLDVKEMETIAKKLFPKMKDLPVPSDKSGKKRTVADLSVEEFSQRILEVTDENTDGKLEWEEFWILYRQFFTEKEAKQGASNACGYLVAVILAWAFLMITAIALTQIDFDGDGKPFLSFVVDHDEIEL